MPDTDAFTRWPVLDVAGRRARLDGGFAIRPGPLADRVAADLARADQASDGLFRRNVSVWSADPDVQRRIAARLGWLGAPALMADARDRLEACAAAAARDGFEHVVLLGMGGSSLAPEVLRAIVATGDGARRFRMLDSTDPAAVAAVDTPPARTLYILASKSGTTIEPNSLAAHFRARLETAGVPRWGDHFIAITDPDTALARLAADERFRDLFLNPADIGGRYSALSFFGLVPAALMGIDVGALLGWGLAMLSAASDSAARGLANPAAALGLLMAAGVRAGRDKLTLVLPPDLEAFGLWVEQLVAESTGKLGTGVVPVTGEPPGMPDVYGADRVFVRCRIAGGPTSIDNAIPADAPSAQIELPEREALAAEFVRWEIATAVAGALLHINPFDEPNVQQAKDATGSLLDRVRAQGALPVPPPDRTDHGVALTLTPAARQQLGGQRPESLLALVQPGDYVALLAYLAPAPAVDEEAGRFRAAVRDRTRAATMFGYGPRYLHSTGQLHKGGPGTGVFVLVSAEAAMDLPIPGQQYTFATLELAQALGDFSSLAAAGRRAVHIHLAASDPALLRRALAALIDRLPRPA